MIVTQYPPPPRLGCRARRVLVALAALRKILGYPPTIDQIAAYTRDNRNNIFYSLTVLRRRGLVADEPELARTRVLTSLGRLAAQGWWPVWTSHRPPAVTGGSP